MPKVRVDAGIELRPRGNEEAERRPCTEVDAQLTERPDVIRDVLEDIDHHRRVKRR
jgi:hypothetical protein